MGGKNPAMPVIVRMTPRDTEEEHRTATPLELFFDLTFVVAVAQAGASVHHGFVTGDAGHALVVFPLVFFAIWWAWMNFTWFASAYDTDDVPYRIAVFVVMTGVLILGGWHPSSLRRHELRRHDGRLCGDATGNGRVVGARCSATS